MIDAFNDASNYDNGTVDIGILFYASFLNIPAALFMLKNKYNFFIITLILLVSMFVHHCMLLYL